MVIWKHAEKVRESYFYYTELKGHRCAWSNSLQGFNFILCTLCGISFKAVNQLKMATKTTGILHLVIGLVTEHMIKVTPKKHCYNVTLFILRRGFVFERSGFYKNMTEQSFIPIGCIINDENNNLTTAGQAMLWLLCQGSFAMAAILWQLCYVSFPMATFLWQLSYG